MIKKCRHLIPIFAGQKASNVLLFLAILSANITSAIFEGSSFAFMLMGFSAINNQGDLSSLGFSWVERFAPVSGYERFIVFILISVLLQAARSFLAFVGLYGNSILGLRIQSDAQYKVYEQILKLSFPSISQYKVGELVEYAKTPSIFIPHFMEAMNRFCVNLFLVIVTLFGMFWISSSMTLCTGIVLGLLIFSQKYIIKKIVGISSDLSNHMAEFSKQTVQSLEGLRLIHTFNEQGTILKKVSSLLKSIASTSRLLSLWNNAIPSINELIGIFSIAAILLSSVFFLHGDVGTVFPLLLTFIALTYRLSTRLQTALGGLGSMAVHFGYISRLNDILTDEGKEFYPQGGASFGNVESQIEFRGISLCYPKTKSPSLKDISFVIPKDCVTALVGSSGSGKSSIIDLLVRLYNPTNGEILIDGKNISDFDIRSWREVIGVVSQDTFIFNETIEENIRFGHVDSTLEEVKEAARIAGAHEFIDCIPSKYQTLVGERGYKLSGGERQRIALARAILRDPQILILDEATSNLDSHSEHLILKALDTFCKNRTVIVIAHRLSTIVSADQILVIEKGRLLESGTHEDLLSNKSKYAKFWMMQSQRHNPTAALHQ